MATAAEIMQSDVITISASSSLAEAQELFQNKRISGAPVVDADGSLVGVLSQTDIIREAATEGAPDIPSGFYFAGGPYWEMPTSDAFTASLDKLTVQQAMSKEPITCPKDEPVAALAARMRENHIHRILVTEKGKLCGIVTTFDMLRMLESH